MQNYFSYVGACFPNELWQDFCDNAKWPIWGSLFQILQGFSNPTLKKNSTEEAPMARITLANSETEAIIIERV